MVSAGAILGQNIWGSGSSPSLPLEVGPLNTARGSLAAL